MFLTLDYRPNLGSTLCTEVSPQDPAGQCGTLLGDAYPNLDTGPGTVTLFDGLRAVYKTIFDELTIVGLTDVEQRISRQTILESCTPPNMTPRQLQLAVEG